MSKAKSEISHWIEYDYVLINEDLAKCSDEVVTILKAERKKGIDKNSLLVLLKSF